MRKVTIDYRVPYADTDQMGVVYYGNYLIGFSVSLQRGCLDDFSYGTPVTEHPFGAVGTQGQLIRCFQHLLQIPFYRFIIKELKQCGIGSYE